MEIPEPHALGKLRDLAVVVDEGLAETNEGKLYFKVQAKIVAQNEALRLLKVHCIEH